MGYTKPNIWLLAMLGCAVSISRGDPFASRVIRFDPAPGQRVNHADFNNPLKALGSPIGATLSAADNTSVVTLGAFGGSITLGFDHTVLDDPLNPHGMDAIIFGNAFWSGGDPNRHWAECGVIEISLDENGNGLADDPWYLIAGSHLPTQFAQSLSDDIMTLTWDDDVFDTTYPPALLSWIPPGSTGLWTTTGYALPDNPFNEILIINSSADPTLEAVFGYADYNPTLPLGDLDADGIVDDPTVLPGNFYTIPDDPLRVGISEGSGGGDAIDIAWAVHPETGEPAQLTGFDFIRITTATNILDGPFGEKSTEVDAVADVKPDPHGDVDMDGDIDLADLVFLQLCFGFMALDDPACQLLDDQSDGWVDEIDVMKMVGRLTGPRS